ncbi:hypothetical protein Btru_059510 [Bulinus truncatus]|nr:hypothetical protein Btru_059510 [Bulinus truncatus]
MVSIFKMWTPLKIKPSGSNEKQRNCNALTQGFNAHFKKTSIVRLCLEVGCRKTGKSLDQIFKGGLEKVFRLQAKTGTDSPPSTAEAIEITVTEYDIVIKRPRPWVRRIPGSTASERARRLNKALMMAEDEDEDKKAKKKS